jgi:hypothetical protein
LRRGVCIGIWNRKNPDMTRTRLGVECRSVNYYGDLAKGAER